MTPTPKAAILAWHFLADGRRLGFGHGDLIEAGTVSAARGRLTLCRNGLHAALRPLDALGYAPGSVIERVRLEGRIIQGPDKLCARQRTCLWIADATNLLHEYACWTAELALAVYEKAGTPIDPRSHAAIEAKRAWLRGDIGNEELDAAQSAAWDAARYPAWGASWHAARFAARDAAWNAAWSAARSAAGYAVEYAPWGDLNAELERRLWTLAPVGYTE